MREIVCTICPNGCRMSVDEANSFAVTGNHCPRGADYGRSELLYPARVLTTTVQIIGAVHPVIPVKTDKPIARDMLLRAVQALDGITIRAPVVCGQVIVRNIAGSGADIVAARSMLQTPLDADTGKTDVTG